MGIREYFKQHPEEQDLRLQDINTKTKERPSVLFDQETEISEKEWEEMIKIQKLYESRGDLGISTHLAMCLKILFPNKIEELKINQEIFEKLKARFDDERKIGWEFCIERAVHIKTFFPEKFKSLNLGNKAIDGILEAIDQYRQEEPWEDNEWNHFADNAVFFEVLFPKNAQDLELDQKIFEKLKIYLEEYRKDKNWFFFCNLAANLKILFPEKINELNLDQKIIDEIKEYLEKSQEDKHWDTYIFIAFRLRILISKEVKITDKGIEIIMPPKDLKSTKTPRPERKKY